MKRLSTLFIIGYILCSGGLCRADIYLNNQTQSYGSLNNTVVYMTGTSELYLTAATSPMTGCTINLNSESSWLFFENIQPSVVNTSAYISQIRVNGALAALNTNIHIVEYVQGTVVIPHGTSYQPLQVFDGINFGGSSRSNFTLHTYYRSAELGIFDNAISSFKLKRGYMATFAANSNGTGPSRVYIADNRDLNIGVMPADLENAASFVRVFPWRWPSKKGIAGWGGDAPTLKTTWRYDWDNVANSTPDIEYIPMRHGRYWNAYSNIDNKQNSTHALGFNEPDRPDQANMTVQEVLEQWPNLVTSGLRLGSPAVSDGGLSWLYSFIDQADALGYRVDFVAVHWYQNNRTAQQMYDWMNSVYRRTGRPIWITEWNNGCNWTEPHPTYEYNATKINELITRMDDTLFIERYSIYQGCTNREMVLNGSLTPAGIVYRDNTSVLAKILDTNFECVGYYRLDETAGTAAADLSGKARTATLMNGLSFSSNSTAGQLGKALQFDGTDDYIQLPAGFSELDNGFSFSCWARPTAVKNWSRLVDLGNGPNSSNILIARYSNTNDLVVQAFNGASGGGYVYAVNALELNKWQYFTVTINTRSSNNVKIYKNGTLIQTGTTAIPAGVLRSNNYIGRSNWSADAYFQGTMDDIRLFDYALTPSEVTSLYQMTVTRPYSGTTAAIPCRIEAEHFDAGSQGSAYHDTTSGNSGGQLRLDADVDVRAVSDAGQSGYSVYQVAEGEWLNYAVNVTQTDTYNLLLRAASTQNNIPVTVKLGGTVLGTITVNSTGSTGTYQTFALNNLPLTAGSQQTLRLEFPVGGLEVNWLEFVKPGPWQGLVRTLPGTIEAEHFDSGGQGSGYWDTTAGNSGGQYRVTEDADIFSHGTAGYAVGDIQNGEWLEYTVSSTAATQDLYARVASTQAGGQIVVKLANVTLATVNIPNTGSLSVWQNVIVPNITLQPQDNIKLRVEFSGTGYLLDWIGFKNRTPFLGAPFELPGTVGAVNYDIGGQWISFYDITAVNTYGYYRSDGAEVTSSGGVDYVYEEPSEWLEYTCNVQAGHYTVTVQSSSTQAGGQLEVSLDGQVLTVLSLPKTSGWTNWQNTSAGGIFVSGGTEKILRLKLTASTNSLRSITFTRHYVAGDINRDTRVNLEDFSILSNQWLSAAGVPSGDVAPAVPDGVVDWLDLITLAENWLMAE